MQSMTNPQDLTNKLFLIYNEDDTKRIAYYIPCRPHPHDCRKPHRKKGTMVKVIANIINKNNGYYLIVP